MAVGKSYLGKSTAEILDMPFYDIDLEIEKAVNMDVNKIFLEKGENFFRKKESEILLNWKNDGVIATGGGIICNEQNREFFKNPDHLVIWLNSSWEKIHSRLQNSYRPMVLNRSEEELFELFEKRLEFYEECADIIFYGHEAFTLKQKILLYEK